jgi:predicted naringenin-chalcone synthase
MEKVFLHTIATCVPEHSYTQEFAIEFLKKLMGPNEKRTRLLTWIYQDSAIGKRHTVIDDYGKDPSEYTFYPPNDRLEPERSTCFRNDVFIREADRLSLRAVRALLAKLAPGIKNKITHIISVSCTGFSAPGFDFHLAKELGLAPDVDRFHLGFMGCYAAFPALKLARSICLAEKDARVLVVNVELCSLHFQKKYETDLMIAHSLFADGISAALVSRHEQDSGGDKMLLHTFHSRFIADSEDKMAWKIGDLGFEMKLSHYVPKFLEANILPIMEGLFGKNGLSMKDIDIWAVHPGGRAILEKLETALGLSREDLRHSYNVLWEYGNMSSSTIMFVLDKIMNSPEYGNIFACAFGPGLTVETACLEKIRC